MSVVIGWVVFRATTLSGAGRILEGMVTPVTDDSVHTLLWNVGLDMPTGGLWCAVLMLIACLAPNSNQIGERLLHLCSSHVTMRTVANGTVLTAVAFLLVVNTVRDSVSAFIYFNF